MRDLSATATPQSSTDVLEARKRRRLIGEELRRWYDSVVTERVPDEWLALLDWADEDLRP